MGKASSGKCNLRVRMWVVSGIKYYKNRTRSRHTLYLPSYRHIAFSTQIFRKLLIVRGTALLVVLTVLVLPLLATAQRPVQVRRIAFLGSLLLDSRVLCDQ